MRMATEFRMPKTNIRMARATETVTTPMAGREEAAPARAERLLTQIQRVADRDRSLVLTAVNPVIHRRKPAGSKVVNAKWRQTSAEVGRASKVNKASSRGSKASKDNRGSKASRAVAVVVAANRVRLVGDLRGRRAVEEAAIHYRWSPRC